MSSAPTNSSLPSRAEPNYREVDFPTFAVIGKIKMKSGLDGSALPHVDEAALDLDLVELLVLQRLVEDPLSRP